MSVTHNKTRLASDFLLLTIGLVSVGTVLFFTFASGVSFSPDRQIDALAKDVIQRVPIALFLLVLCLTTDLKSGLRFTVTPAVRLFALVPCLLVALANFFGVSVDYLVSNDEVRNDIKDSLTEEQRKLFRAVSQLDVRSASLLADFLESLQK